MKDRNYPPAFVTYGWCRNAYTVVRSLGIMGVEVHVGDPSFLAMSRVSRYCESFTRLPDFFAEPDRYFDETCKALKKTGAKVLLPCHEDIGIFCKRRNDLPPDVMVALPDAGMYELVEDKLDCIEIAQKHGCPTPRTYKISDFRDLEQFRNNTDWPLVIKPRISNGSKGVSKVNSYEKLVSEFRGIIELYNLPGHRWPVIQQFLPGKIAWAGVLYLNGRCVAASSCRPFRHKELDVEGNATLRETGDFKDLINKSVSLMDKLNWHGIAQLEFIQDKTGSFFLTEINARPWGSIVVPVFSGVDMPYLWYLIALDKMGPDYVDEARKVKCRWIIGDCIGLIEAMRVGKFSKAVEIIKPVRHCYHDDFSLADPMPLLFESLDYLVRFVKWRGSISPVVEGMVR
jgi:predicted ATP-grasp superfamily ATP-dependent carboligase